MQRNPVVPACRQRALLTVARLYAVPSTFGFSAARALLICCGVNAATALIAEAKKPASVATATALMRAMLIAGQTLFKHPSTGVLLPALR
jgi:hypothetical protein